MTIDNIKVQSTATTIVTVPPSGELASVVIMFCNTHPTTTEAIDVHLVKNGDSASDVNLVAKKVTIIAEETFMFNMERFIITDGDTIQAIGLKGNLVSASISYKEI